MNIKLCIVLVSFLGALITNTARSNIIDTATIFNALRASMREEFKTPAYCYTLKNTYTMDGEGVVNVIYDVKIKDAYLLANSKKELTYGLTYCLVSLNYEDSIITVIPRDTMTNYYFANACDYRVLLISIQNESTPFFILKQEQDTIVFERMYDEYRGVHRTYRNRIYFNIKLKRITKISTDVYEKSGKEESVYFREIVISNYTNNCELSIKSEQLPIFENVNVHQGLVLNQKYRGYKVLNISKVPIN